MEDALQLGSRGFSRLLGFDPIRHVLPTADEANAVRLPSHHAAGVKDELSAVPPNEAMLALEWSALLDGRLNRGGEPLAILGMHMRLKELERRPHVTWLVAVK